MLSPDSICKTFDKDANGYGRGEGCGVLLLKRLDDAQQDGNNVLAVIKSSAVNQDGASSGLTVPNGKAQEAVIKQALVRANLTANDIDYIDAHGTGTSLGDPIELNTLEKVFGASREKNSFLTVGTVKTTVGHLESAAGVAGIIKTILSMRNKTIPKHIHFNELNPYIEAPNIKLPLKNNIKWHRKDADIPLLAGVSSFGFSGTNAHVILEEFISNVPSQEVEPDLNFPDVYILTLSARTNAALRAICSLYLEKLNLPQFEDKQQLLSLCFYASTSREAQAKKVLISGLDSKEFSQAS